MLKIRKKLMAAGLAALIATSAAAVPVWSEAGEAAEASAEAADAASAEPVAEDDGIYVTEEQALEGMEVYASNSKLNLYVNKKKSAGKVDMVVSLINALYLLQVNELDNAENDFGCQVI